MVLDENGVRVIVFSKDRPLQLDATLRSFMRHCRDHSNVEIAILFAASDLCYEGAYERLADDFSDHENVTMIRERDFRQQVLELVAGCTYVVWLVDDAIFVRDFELAPCVALLEGNESAIGYSLRLGRNTTYSYAYDAPQSLPDFTLVEPDTLRFDWTSAEYDFAYPLELSSSLYRTATLLPLLEGLQFQNPNSFESAMAARASEYGASHPDLLCPPRTLAFCLPINKVQTVHPNNRAGSSRALTSEMLLARYVSGQRIDVAAFDGFVPQACHQEVELVFEEPTTKIVQSESCRNQIDISVVMTTHDEGTVAHFALRGLERSVEYARSLGLKVETIIVVDDGDELTAEVVRAWATDEPTVRVVTVAFGDTGSARMAGLAAGRGEFAAVIDGDDYVTENWLSQAWVRMQLEEGDVVVHPEYCISFGTMKTVARSPDQISDTVALRKQLFVANYWWSASFSRRQLFLDCPYQPADVEATGFAFEDWHWNLELIAGGARHLVAPKTALFYRRRPSSRLVDQLAAKGIPRPSALYDWQDETNCDEAVSEAASEEPPAPKGHAGRAMARAMVAAMRRMWRTVAHPVLRRAPLSLQQAILTTIHHLKNVWWHGRVLPLTLQQATLTTAQHVKDVWWHGNVLPLSLNDDGLSARLEPSRTGKVNEAIPEWVVPEFAALAEIEPALWPSPEFLRDFKISPLWHHPEPGAVYCKLRQAAGSKPVDLVLLVPWLVRGGCDQGILHHAEAVAATGRQVVVIATDNLPSPWVDRLPPAVPFLPLGQLAHRLTHDEQLFILTRLVAQLSPASVHIMNSHLGWQMVCNHGRALETLGCRLHASVFAEVPQPDGRRWSFADDHLAGCLPHLSTLITDSPSYTTRLQSLYGVAPRKLHTVYFPTKVPKTATWRGSAARRVLWAGRVTWTRRPELVVDIARCLPDVTFHVAGNIDDDIAARAAVEMEQLSNIVLHGVYEDFSAVVDAIDPQLVLHTSLADGIPNTLLEAIAHGLPAVATAVGGIPDVISEETGWLVPADAPAETYATIIAAALAAPEERQRRWSRANELVRSRHSSERFAESLTAIPGYLDLRAENVASEGLTGL